MRIDLWLWAVRLFPSRTASTAACKAGRVQLGGRTVKPSATVGPGDRVHAVTPGGEREVEVVNGIRRRVGAAIAAGCYVDHTPPAPPRVVDTNGRRDRGSGRPTKRERREIDRLRGRHR
ncbi:MAG: RNA-binding S4 domain-containing protein [Acidimicrobiales bacterium]